MVRKILRPKAWCEFDKFSANFAGERNRVTINSVGLGSVDIHPRIEITVPEGKILSLLLSKGWDGESELIVLNPAGYFPSRNWPIENYIKFAVDWLLIFPKTQFVFIGISRIKIKAEELKRQLDNRIIDLTNDTSIAEAFALLKKVKLVLTEDGGLMHMAWVQGIPTIALFGSTRAEWSTPLGDWSVCLNSSDMECGSCLLEVCKFGDNRCLIRYSPAFVVEKAKQLLVQNGKS